MPFPNEHAARQADPSQFSKFRRSTLNLPKGITAIIGIKANGKSAIQSLRFDRKLWTAEKAKAWLKKHNMKSAGFEAATQKSLWDGVI